MLGRGVKRKWSCLEELEADVLPAEKERNEEDGGGDGGENGDGFLAAPSKSDMSHLQQRQLVLGLCMEKLQSYQAGVELSLRRSVLLINTLRQIQEDMQSDGVVTRTLNADACILREHVSVTCPGCSKGDGDCPLSPEFPSQEANASQEKPPPQPVAAAAAINTFSDAVNAMGYLSDLTLDDIFEDIDTSMYETSDLPSGLLWPVSVSLWADEDAKMRPQSHSTAATGSLQSCLMDLNELDHIMEILVKS